ncbi:MAG TPA: RHS repeat-associated core domain-containing protein [Herpetosiphonaceae bacterium]
MQRSIASSATPETSLNFTGQRKDATGLLYYHARYYDPELGRFLSADTVVAEVGALTMAPSDTTAAPLFAQGGQGSGSRTPQEWRPSAS